MYQTFGQDVDHAQFLNNMDLVYNQAVTPIQSSYYGHYQQYYHSMGYPDHYEPVPDIDELMHSVQSAFVHRKLITEQKNKHLEKLLPRIGTSDDASR